jgi:hypothetical protein
VQIDSVIEAALTEHRIVGTVVLIARDGEVVYENAAGFADRESGGAQGPGPGFGFGFGGAVLTDPSAIGSPQIRCYLVMGRCVRAFLVRRSRTQSDRGGPHEHRARRYVGPVSDGSSERRLCRTRLI